MKKNMKIARDILFLLVGFAAILFNILDDSRGFFDFLFILAGAVFLIIVSFRSLTSTLGKNNNS